MEKEDLLELLLEKNIISKVENFDQLSKAALEELLDNGMNLVAASITIEEINEKAIEFAKDALLENKDGLAKNLSIENKRLTQKIAKLKEDCKSKIVELAKLFDEPKAPKSKQ